MMKSELIPNTKLEVKMYSQNINKRSNTSISSHQ